MNFYFTNLGAGKWCEASRTISLDKPGHLRFALMSDSRAAEPLMVTFEGNTVTAFRELHDPRHAENERVFWCYAEHPGVTSFRAFLPGCEHPCATLRIVMRSHAELQVEGYWREIDAVVGDLHDGVPRPEWIAIYNKSSPWSGRMRALVWLSGEAGDEGRGRYSYKKYPAEAEGYEWEMAPERARAGRELMQHFLANRGDDETANMWADVIVGTTRDLGSQALIVARVSTRELRYRHAPFEHPSKPSGVPEMMVVEKFLAQECHSHRPRT